jgi:hypothetical protein
MRHTIRGIIVWNQSHYWSSKTALLYTGTSALSGESEFSLIFDFFFKSRMFQYIKNLYHDTTVQYCWWSNTMRILYNTSTTNWLIFSIPSWAQWTVSHWLAYYILQYYSGLGCDMIPSAQQQQRSWLVT